MYSEKEKKLIEHFGYSDLIHVVPSVLYEIIAMDCFMKNKQGREVDSVRKCLSAIKNCNPYRLTEEFENLIEV